MGLLSEAGFEVDLARLVGDHLKCEECVQNKTGEEVEEINCLVGECYSCSKSICWNCSFTIPRRVQLPEGNRVVRELICDSCVTELHRETDRVIEERGVLLEGVEPDFHDSDNEPHWL